MSVPETDGSDAAAVHQTARAVIALLAEGRQADVPEEITQRLLVAAVKLYVAKCSVDGAAIAPWQGDAVTATEVAITVCAMLDAVHLELFELEMWKSFGRV